MKSVFAIAAILCMACYCHADGCKSCSGGSCYLTGSATESAGSSCQAQEGCTQGSVKRGHRGRRCR